MVFMNDGDPGQGDPGQIDRTWFQFLLSLFINQKKLEEAGENLLEKTSYIPGNTSELLQLGGKIIPNTYMAHAAGTRAVKAFKHITRQGGWRKPGFYLNTASCIACGTSCAVGVFCKIGPTARLQAFLYSTGTFLGSVADGLEGNPPSNFPPP